MELSSRFGFVVLIAIVLNLGGAVVSKFLALHISDLVLASFWGFMLGLVYVARMKYWVWAGRIYQLSYLYPFISLSYIVSLLFGHFVFKETISINKVLGSMLIVAGVFTVSYSTNKKESQ